MFQTKSVKVKDHNRIDNEEKEEYFLNRK